MIIAAAHPSQINEVVALWEKCNLTQPGEDPVLDAQQIIDSPMSVLIVAEDEDTQRVVGTAVAGFDGHRGSVYYLASAPESLDSDIEGELLGTACEWLEDRGAASVRITAAPSDVNVHGFLAGHGFQKSEAVVFEKPLIDG